MSTVIGYITNTEDGRIVRCPSCYNACDDLATGGLYHESVYPYKQTCHVCDMVLVEGKTPAWCEFHTKPLAKTKLTLVTINGIPKLLNLPIVNGKPEITWAQIQEHWNLVDNACIMIG